MSTKQNDIWKENKKEIEDDNSICPLCKTPFITKTEAREGGHYEVVDYCEGCGYMSTMMK